MELLIKRLDTLVQEITSIKEEVLKLQKKIKLAPLTTDSDTNPNPILLEPRKLRSIGYNYITTINIVYCFADWTVSNKQGYIVRTCNLCNTTKEIRNSTSNFHITCRDCSKQDKALYRGLDLRGKLPTSKNKALLEQVTTNLNTNNTNNLEEINPIPNTELNPIPNPTPIHSLTKREELLSDLPSLDDELELDDLPNLNDLPLPLPKV